MDLELKGKRAIVVGGTRGIGRAIAGAFAQEGADVAICARNGDQVDQVVNELSAAGVRSFGRAVDVADGDALESFIADMGEALGGVDAYVSNASGAFGGGNDLASWQRGFEVDLLGTLRGCEAVVPLLETSEQGSIIIIGSVSALEAVTERRAYNSIKAALLPYSKLLARTLAPKGIRCNVVSPGQILFDGGIWDVVRELSPDAFAQALERNPMGRMGTPQEVANAVVFLASRRAGFISGTNLVCDGARTEGVQF